MHEVKHFRDVPEEVLELMLQERKPEHEPYLRDLLSCPECFAYVRDYLARTRPERVEGLEQAQVRWKARLH